MRSPIRAGCRRSREAKPLTPYGRKLSRERRDERSLSGVARHARNEATAIAALGRLTDSAELVEVAQNSEHRDVALAAFERVIAGGVDLALVRSIESRGQQKAVSRRARAVIQEIEAAEQSRRAAEEDRRRREVGFCDAVERVADISDLAAARTELARLDESWAAFGATDADDPGAVRSGAPRPPSPPSRAVNWTSMRRRNRRGSAPRRSRHAMRCARGSRRSTATTCSRNCVRSKKTGNR